MIKKKYPEAAGGEALAFGVGATVAGFVVPIITHFIDQFFYFLKKNTIQSRWLLREAKREAKSNVRIDNDDDRTITTKSNTEGENGVARGAAR